MPEGFRDITPCPGTVKRTLNGQEWVGYITPRRRGQKEPHNAIFRHEFTLRTVPAYNTPAMVGEMTSANPGRVRAYNTLRQRGKKTSRKSGRVPGVEGA